MLGHGTHFKPTDPSHGQACKKQKNFFLSSTNAGGYKCIVIRESYFHSFLTSSFDPSLGLEDSVLDYASPWNTCYALEGNWKWRTIKHFILPGQSRIKIYSYMKLLKTCLLSSDDREFPKLISEQNTALHAHHLIWKATKTR